MKIFKFKLNFLSTFLSFCILCIGTTKYVYKYLQSIDGHYSNYVIVILMLLLITVANDICQTNFKHHGFHCLLPTYSIYLYICSFIFLMYINT